MVGSLWRFLSARIASLPKETWPILGVMLVGLVDRGLYLIYFQFYAAFGLRPNDVGLSKLRLLDESLLGLVLAPVQVLVERFPLVSSVMLATALLSVVVQISAHRFRSKAPRRTVWYWREAFASGMLGFVVTMSILLPLAYSDAIRESAKLGVRVRESGQIVVAWTEQGPGPIAVTPYLDMLALPVLVVRKADSPAMPLIPECVLYLGEANSKVVLFDVRQELVVRVPTSSISVLMTSSNAARYDQQRLRSSCAQDG